MGGIGPWSNRSGVPASLNCKQRQTHAASDFWRHTPMATERERRQQARDRDVPWRRWGPYLSERQWEAVRQDDRTSGNGWDQWSRAYRRGEDGLTRLSDDKRRLCF